MRAHALRTAVLCAALFLLLILFPAYAGEGARAGLSLCGRVLVPSLLPLMILSDLALSPGAAGASPLGMMLLSFAGGYPLGARRVCEAVAAGQISREEGRRRLRCCCNCGAGFLLGAAGTRLTGSPLTGFALLGVQMLSAGVLRLLFRGQTSPGAVSVPADLPAPSFARSLKKGTEGMLSVCGCAVLFSALLGVLRGVGFLALLRRLHPAAEAVFCGFAELCCGLEAAAGLESGPLALAICSAGCGWGGICVHLQTLPFLEGAGYALRDYLPGKALQGLLCFVLALGLFSLPFFEGMW